jgi:hypothetical protein
MFTVTVQQSFAQTPEAAGSLVLAILRSPVIPNEQGGITENGFVFRNRSAGRRTIVVQSLL